MKGLSAKSKWRSAVQILVGGHLVAAGLATYMGNETWYSKCLMPCLRLIGPETAHWLAVKAAKYKLVPYIKQDDHACLKTQVWGRHFKNPIGLAAGFDKNAEAVDGLFRLGFGFIEVGSVTPRPQEGNAKPRIFRLTKERAIINRYGFNSDGHQAVLDRIKSRAETPGCVIPDDRNQLNEQLVSPDRPRVTLTHRPESGVVGVNLGKNRDSADAAEDYVAGVRELGPVADYIVINVSSPNTPGLRALQGRQQLQQLVDKVVEERNKLPAEKRPPVLVKIAPDLSEQDKIDVASVLARPKAGVDGLIVSNTTVSRPAELTSPHKYESGGLSGPPLRDMSTQLIRDMYRLTQGRLPIVGVGGVSCGQDAYEKLCAGASLVQIYTVMAYEGPTIIHKIKKQLSDILQEQGINSVSEVVGLDFRNSASSAEKS